MNTTVRDLLEARVKECSQVLARFPRRPSGLVPDAVRCSDEYRDARDAYNAAFSALRQFNRECVR